MRRDFAAGISSWEHRALVMAAIEERAARKGISREEAAREVLDEECEWRRRELAARWSPGDSAARVAAGAAHAAGRLIRRAAGPILGRRAGDRTDGR
jgi:hypothetical protein